MTDTIALERFIDYLNFPEYISFLYDRGATQKYIHHAGELFTNLIKEARENRAELISTGKDINRYYKDLNKKIEFNRKSTFERSEGGIIHKYSRIKLGDESVDRYRLLNYIYDAYDQVRDHFEELSTSGTSKPIVNQGPTTSFPSFTVKHNSTAYDLHAGLKRLVYINCDLKTFLDAFTGMEVRIRIQWLQANSHLTHFIKRLISEGLINDPGKDNIWPLTMKVFVKSNGNDFKRTELSTASSHVRKKGVPALDDLIYEIKPKDIKEKFSSHG